MKWSEFLQSLSIYNSIDIVGPFGSSWQPSSRPAIFVDGGTKWQKPAALTVAVGDGDSSSRSLDMKLSPQKDFSDFAFALRSLPQNITQVFASGFLGGRRDHELANLGEAHAFLKARLKPTVILWDQEAIFWSAGTWDFHWRGIFTLLSIESVKIKVEGECRYQLHQPTEIASLSSFGLSNEGFGQIHIWSDGPVLLCLNRDTIT